MVVEFARYPIPSLCFPENSVEIREVVMDVEAVVTPAAQRPSAELRALKHDRETHFHSAGCLIIMSRSGRRRTAAKAFS